MEMGGVLIRGCHEYPYLVDPRLFHKGMILWIARTQEALRAYVHVMLTPADPLLLIE